jgi:chorismate mutase
MESDRIESLWNRIRQHLERERHRIYGEIRNYPPPIPACDAQFNHLLEERRRISQELAELEQLSTQHLTPEQQIKSIDSFISSSSCIDDEVDREIRSCLNEPPSGPDEPR